MALVAGLCATPLAVQGSPGHSSTSAHYHATAGVPRLPDAAVSQNPYHNFGFATDGATYQTVSDLERLLNRAGQYYNRYRSDRNRSRSSRGYYRYDPDDRNNPRHPGYIGPQGTYYRSYPYRSYRGNNYYPNDPDDRNNPNHPGYIGPQGSYFRGWR